jgi:nucleoside-triphosphatase
MECMSLLFRRLLGDLLDSDKLLLATVAARGGGMIAEVKHRSDVILYELTRSNRETLDGQLAALVRKRLGS